jgi:hypothetical protein
MLKIRFAIDRRLLAYRYWVSLFASQNESGSKLRHKLEHRYGDYAGFYIFVPGQMQYAILPDWRVSKQSVRLFIRDDRIVTAALRDIMASHEFSGVYEETLVYLGYVRSCWNNHFLKIANYFSELFGRQLGTTLAVLVFPSRMRLGSYLGMTLLNGVQRIFTQAIKQSGLLMRQCML